MSFDIQTQDHILYLTLNTPGSSVNIFDLHAATQLEQVMNSLHQERSIRAAIIRSSKPKSFINGVGLLMASAVKVPEDASTLTLGIRRAYESVKNSPVPTVAAIQGNCYGCGVEFILNCDYRVAENTYDSHFYMTEIADYLFIPAFGGTQNLPRLLGLEKATDFLLWGEKWSPLQAKRYHLIDAVFSPEEFDQKLERFIKKIIKTPRPIPLELKSRIKSRAASIKKTVQATQLKIKNLPPHSHSLYKSCFKLMASSVRKNRLHKTDYDKELQASGISVMNPDSKAALSFFFVRQSVQSICLRGEAHETTAWHAHFPRGRRGPRENDPLNQLKMDLKRRKLKPTALNPKGQSTQVSFLPSIHTGLKYEPDQTWAFTFLEMTSHSPSPHPLLYSPAYLRGLPFFELASQDASKALTFPIFRYLYHSGFNVICSKPDSEFAINLFLSAYFSPLLSYLRQGGSPNDIHFTLRKFGFSRRPDFLLNLMDVSKLLGADSKKDLLRLGKPWNLKGRFDQKLVDVLNLSLLATSSQCLAKGILAHPCLIDLIAREVLDFPLSHGSLCQFLKKDRIRNLLARQASFHQLASASDIALAEEFLARGKNFYL